MSVIRLLGLCQRLTRTKFGSTGAMCLSVRFEARSLTLKSQTSLHFTSVYFGVTPEAQLQLRVELFFLVFDHFGWFLTFFGAFGPFLVVFDYFWCVWTVFGGF